MCGDDREWFFLNDCVSSAIPYPKGAGEPRLILDQRSSHRRALLHDSMSSGYEVRAELWRAERFKGINGNRSQHAAAKRDVISRRFTWALYSP